MELHGHFKIIFLKDAGFSLIIVQLRFKEVREIDQEHTVHLWQNWDQKPGFF